MKSSSREQEQLRNHGIKVKAISFENTECASPGYERFIASCFFYIFGAEQISSSFVPYDIIDVSLPVLYFASLSGSNSFPPHRVCKRGDAVPF
jgi:hypothetical protein